MQGPWNPPAPRRRGVHSFGPDHSGAKTVLTILAVLLGAAAALLGGALFVENAVRLGSHSSERARAAIDRDDGYVDILSAVAHKDGAGVGVTLAIGLASNSTHVDASKVQFQMSLGAGAARFTSGAVADASHYSTRASRDTNRSLQRDPPVLDRGDLLEVDVPLTGTGLDTLHGGTLTIVQDQARGAGEAFAYRLPPVLLLQAQTPLARIN